MKFHLLAVIKIYKRNDKYINKYTSLTIQYYQEIYH